MKVFSPGSVFLCAVLLLLSAVPVFSHPHMFIDTEVTFEFDRDELKGFWIKWYFDVMFTASIRLDYDYDRDGVFDSAEVSDIEQGAFQNLRAYHYFTRVIRDDGVDRVEEVDGFSARMEDDRLVYRFFVPYTCPLSAETCNLSLIIFDETFFCDIMYMKDSPVHIEGTEYAAADARIRANRDFMIEYDPTGGQGRSQGSEAPPASGRAFPYELLLSYRKK